MHTGSSHAHGLQPCTVTGVAAMHNAHGLQPCTVTRVAAIRVAAMHTGSSLNEGISLYRGIVAEHMDNIQYSTSVKHVGYSVMDKHISTR